MIQYSTSTTVLNCAVLATRTVNDGSSHHNTTYIANPTSRPIKPLSFPGWQTPALQYSQATAHGAKLLTTAVSH